MECSNESISRDRIKYTCMYKTTPLSMIGPSSNQEAQLDEFFFHRILCFLKGYKQFFIFFHRLLLIYPNMQDPKDLLPNRKRNVLVSNKKYEDLSSSPSTSFAVKTSCRRLCCSSFIGKSSSSSFLLVW